MRTKGQGSLLTLLILAALGCSTSGIQMYPVRGAGASLENMASLPQVSTYDVGESPYLFIHLKKGSGLSGEVSLVVSGAAGGKEAFRKSFHADEGYMELRLVDVHLDKGDYIAELIAGSARVVRCTFSVKEVASSKDASRAPQDRKDEAKQGLPPHSNSNKPTKGEQGRSGVSAYLKVKSDTDSTYAVGTDVVFRSALVERRAESLPVDRQIFETLAPATQQFLLKQHAGVTDLILSTETRSCGMHDAKSFTPGELTLLVAVSANKQPLTVGTRTKPAIVVALPAGGPMFYNPETTQGPQSRVRVDAIDKANGVVKGRVAISGSVVLTSDFVATYCQ